MNKKNNNGVIQFQGQRFSETCLWLKLQDGLFLGNQGSPFEIDTQQHEQIQTIDTRIRALLQQINKKNQKGNLP